MKRRVAICAALAIAAVPLSAQSRPLRVLITHDMEGLSGQDDWRTFSHNYPEQYARGQRLLVADVNAVVAGLFDGGATAVDVTDGHGSGNTEPDIPLELLDARAKMIFKDHPFDPYLDLQQPDAYQAVALVGMHGKPGSRGFAAHTWNPGAEIIMNGMTLAEPELNGYSWGRVGVPVIFVAGDDRLQGNLADRMPWIEYVVTKRSTSASTAELRPVDEVHAEMRAAAKRALQGVAGARVMRLTAPITAQLRAIPPAPMTKTLRRSSGRSSAEDAPSCVSMTRSTLFQAVL